MRDRSWASFPGLARVRLCLPCWTFVPAFTSCRCGTRRSRDPAYPCTTASVSVYRVPVPISSPVRATASPLPALNPMGLNRNGSASSLPTPLFHSALQRAGPQVAWRGALLPASAVRGTGRSGEPDARVRVRVRVLRECRCGTLASRLGLAASTQLVAGTYLPYHTPRKLRLPLYTSPAQQLHIYIARRQTSYTNTNTHPKIYRDRQNGSS